MEKKIAAWRRPISWIVCFLLFWVAGILANLMRNGGTWIFDWLSYQSTLAIVLLVLFGGGTFLSIVVYSVPLLSQLIVSISEAIFPSKACVRYYIIGGYHIINYLFTIIMAAVGVITYNGSMFLYYVFCVYMIVLSVVVMKLAKDNKS